MTPNDEHTDEHEAPSRRSRGRRQEDRESAERIRIEYEERARAEEKARQEKEKAEKEKIEKERERRWNWAWRIIGVVGPVVAFYAGSKQDIGYLQTTPSARIALLETRVTALETHINAKFESIESSIEDASDRANALIALRCIDPDTDDNDLRLALGKYGISCTQVLSPAVFFNGSRMNPPPFVRLEYIPIPLPLPHLPLGGQLSLIVALPAGKKWPWSPLYGPLQPEV